ncbi:hypothetical protein T265_12085 [Opisthorchis viverrini]|uniref:Uncharacterized protein n=1 Tax=Opisthorchis viverrini TaxID=6198 RepID=A0A074YW90_OPIVI|nr:hypothetical protein T265_12085 [Opisthorchis viverrini]KER18953.1 hypothetical protein T265_12085 [Opisthorchis viverrini]
MVVNNDNAWQTALSKPGYLLSDDLCENIALFLLTTTKCKPVKRGAPRKFHIDADKLPDAEYILQ